MSPMSIVSRFLPLATVERARKILARWRTRKYADRKAASDSIGDIDDEWSDRISDVLKCPDNEFIPRVPNAGSLVEGKLMMHNGIQVSALGYYGAGMMNLLMQNKGVHEPQEERAFMEVLKHIEPGSVMIEAGAYWGFYSLWFSKEVPGAKCILIEPVYENILSGIDNFRRHELEGSFIRAFVGSHDDDQKEITPTVSIDGICAANKLDAITILHADVQGAELDMLNGASGMLSRKKVDYVFISTHSDFLHAACVDMLNSFDYVILASANMQETFSMDGLIVARSPVVSSPESLSISKKTMCVRP